MGKSVNQVTLLGRLVADVDLRQTPGGKAVASFTLAVDKFGNQADGAPSADFFDVTAWEKLAELLDQYTGKGSKILLLGRIQQETWEDKDTHKKRSKVTVVANDVTFLDSKQDTENQNTNPKQTSADATDDEPVNLDDIPF